MNRQPKITTTSRRQTRDGNNLFTFTFNKGEKEYYAVFVFDIKGLLILVTSKLSCQVR